MTTNFLEIWSKFCGSLIFCYFERLSCCWCYSSFCQLQQIDKVRFSLEMRNKSKSAFWGAWATPAKSNKYEIDMEHPVRIFPSNTTNVDEKFVQSLDGFGGSFLYFIRCTRCILPSDCNKYNESRAQYRFDCTRGHRVLENVVHVIVSSAVEKRVQGFSDVLYDVICFLEV